MTTINTLADHLINGEFIGTILISIQIDSQGVWVVKPSDTFRHLITARGIGADLVLNHNIEDSGIETFVIGDRHSPELSLDDVIDLINSPG